MKPLNILYVHRTQANLAEGEHIRGMIGGFSAAGHAVTLLEPPGIDAMAAAALPTNSASSSALGRLLRALAEHAPQILFEAIEMLYNLPGWWRLRRLLKRQRVDLIYERYGLNTFFSAAIVRRTGIPYVLEVNDATVIERSRPLWLRGLSRRIEAYVLARADLVITISTHFRQLLVDAYALPPERVLVTPNAISAAKFSDVRPADPAPFGIDPQRHTVIACAGAFVPWHGLELLLDALHGEAVARELYFLFIGDGPVRDDVEAQAAALGIGDRVRFTGFVAPSEVPGLLALADICAIPDSNAHCSPMKLFEYMAMGKPAVVPDYPPLQETVSAGTDALVFPARDGAALAASIRALVDDPEQARRIGAAARATVYERYTWEGNARSVLEALGMLRPELGGRNDELGAGAGAGSNAPGQGAADEIGRGAS